MQSRGDLNTKRVCMPESQGQRSTRAPGREGTEEQRQVSARQGGQGQRSQVIGTGTIVCDGAWKRGVAGQLSSSALEWRKSQETKSLSCSAITDTYSVPCYENKGDSDTVPDSREPIVGGLT